MSCACISMDVCPVGIQTWTRAFQYPHTQDFATACETRQLE